MKKKQVTIIIIMLTSLMFLGLECPSSTEPEPDPPPPGLSGSSLNGAWIYLDFTSGGVQYPLEDSLYHDSNTEWAVITFQDYEDTAETDEWFFREYSELWTTYGEDGTFKVSYGGLDLDSWTTGLHYAFYNWSVHGDTLILADYYDPEWFYRLIDSEVWPGWEPELLDIGYNGDWVFVDIVVYGNIQLLEYYLYNSSAADWAVMEFRNYEDDSYTDIWDYSEHNQVVSNLENMGGALVDDGSLHCYFSPGPPLGLIWESFNWSLEAGDTLHLIWADDPNIYYRLIPLANFVEPGPPMKDIDYNGTWVYTDYFSHGSYYPLEDSVYVSPDAECAKLELADFLYDEMQDTWHYFEQDQSGGNVYSLAGEMSEPNLSLNYYDSSSSQWIEWNQFHWMPGEQDTLFLFDEHANANVHYKLVPE